MNITAAQAARMSRTQMGSPYESLMKYVENEILKHISDGCSTCCNVYLPPYIQKYGAQMVQELTDAGYDVIDLGCDPEATYIISWQNNQKN